MGFDLVNGSVLVSVTSLSPDGIEAFIEQA